MSKICVLGAGSWGIALAKLLANNGNDVTVWSCIQAEIDMLNEHHEHLDKLPGVKLPDSITYTVNATEAMEGAKIIVMAVPSPFVRNTAKQIAKDVKDDQIIVNVAKGIEESTLTTLSSVIESEIPNAKVAVLSGPSHAEEVGKDIPTVVAIGCADKEVAKTIQETFMNERFRVYISPDVLGIEIGAALKNVIALAAGMADGIGFGDNTKAALITRGMAEITRLGIAMGGHAETFYGLSGIGDLIVTCASMHSRNRRAGILIGQGKTMQEAMDEVKMVVEGVNSAKAALLLSQKYNVEMPIVNEVNKVLFENKTAKDTVTDLMLRESKAEITKDWN